MFGSILINNDAADKSLAKTDKKAEGVGTTLAKGIGTAAKWGIGLAAAAGTGMVALLGVATKASETTDRIDKLSNKIGISKKGFQEWDYVLGQNGMDVEKLQVGVKTLVMQMGLAADGSKKAAGSFGKLGVSWEDGNGKLKSQEVIMNESIMALANMENGTEKAKIATELFGKAGIEMMPMLNNGAEGITELKDRAHELGLVLSDEAVNSGVVLGDTIDDVKDSFGAIVTKIGVEVMPIVQNLLEWVLANMPTIQAVASVAFGVISNLIQSVGYHLTNTVLPAFNAFWEWLQPNLPLIQDAIQVAFDMIKQAISTTIDVIKSIIDWCIKYQELLIPLGVAVGAIATAFGIYTAAMAAWTVVTGIATGVGAAFGAVLAFITSPIGLVVLAIGALIAIGVLLYRNWDTIKEVAMNVFGAIGGFIGGIVDGIKGAFSGLVNGIIDNLNWIIGAVNGLSFDVPDWVPVIGGETFGFNIPTIPSFEVGTRYLPKDMLVQAHEGEMIVPKSENPYANTKTGETIPDSGGFTIKIENFINNRQQDVEAFAEELQFYMKQKAVGGGN